jgi:hypothetical protein
MHPTVQGGLLGGHKSTPIRHIYMQSPQPVAPHKELKICRVGPQLVLNFDKRFSSSGLSVMGPPLKLLPSSVLLQPDISQTKPLQYVCWSVLQCSRLWHRDVVPDKKAGGPVRHPYARVDYLPLSWTLLTALFLVPKSTES